ncbi:MAG: hypothetical protein ACLGIB_11440 [Actinomycetota bacterium]
MATAPENFDSTEPAAPSRTRMLVVTLGILVMLLLLVWFFFLRGDGGDVAETATPPAPAPTTTSLGDDDETQTPKQRPVETFEVFAPKDPFDPLISASATAGGASGGTTVAGDGTTITTGGDGTTSTDGTGTTTVTTTSGNGGGGSDVGGHRVRVIDVFQEDGNGRVQVQVDGTVYTVDEGERFAQNFQLLSTSGQCATMLYGDDEFTLCEGEEILK